MRNITLSLTVFFTLLFSWNFATTPLDSIGVTKINEQMHIRYLVSPGETIYGISTHYGVPISQLMDINPELESGLKVGQVINIPYNKAYIDARAEAKSSNKIIHKVKPGETLYGISKQYGIELGDLLKWNGMELQAGQDLVVGIEPEKEKKSEQDVEEEKIVEEKEEKKAEAAYAKANPEMVATKEKDIIYHDKYDYDPDFQQVLIIPFDPHLYFSDADDEIAARSNIHRTMVREVFRRRLNAMLDPPGYETIHLMGGENPDTLADLNKIYSSVSYNYQERLYSDAYVENYQGNSSKKKSSFGQWLDKQKGKLFDEGEDNTSKEKGKYFGVKVRDPEFYNYFNTKYSVDYYVFINQFEVITDYENCLDRAAQNFRRYFVTHYSIFDKDGNQISGNKFRVYYNSNSNSVMQIVADNIPQIAERIMAELPPAAEGR